MHYHLAQSKFTPTLTRNATMCMNYSFAPWHHLGITLWKRYPKLEPTTTAKKLARKSETEVVVHLTQTSGS